MALPTLRIIGFIIGIFLITLALSMVIPMLTLLVFEHPEDLNAFLWSSMITLVAGLALVIPGRPQNAQLRPRDMYLLTTGSWLVVCIFAALPMVLIHHISYTDAFFETMSGVTTTGSTVLSGLDTASPGLLIWRSMLQWLGGIGFIAMAVAVLPLLRVGGMRLFQTESSDWGEKVMPRSHMAAKYILGIYSLLTLLGCGAFWLAGMTPFDAINHSMSMISTGGRSIAATTARDTGCISSVKETALLLPEPSVHCRWKVVACRRSLKSESKSRPTGMSVASSACLASGAASQAASGVRVTTPSPGCLVSSIPKSVQRCCTNMSNSSKLPSSSSSSMRSRAVSLPLACCASIRFCPPPSRAAARRFSISAILADIVGTLAAMAKIRTVRCDSAIAKSTVILQTCEHFFCKSGP